MSPSASLLLCSCIGLTALWPSNGFADTFKASSYPSVAKDRARLTLEPPRAPSWRHGISYHLPPAFRLLAPVERQRLQMWGTPYYAPPLARLEVRPWLADWAPRDTAAPSVTLQLVRAAALGDPSVVNVPASRVAPQLADVAVAPGGRSQAPHAGSERTPSGALALGYALPSLLRYSDEETDVSVWISPGGPCTGACLKVAGSF